MINDTGRLNDLLTKFVSDKASEQEVRELFTLLKESNDETPVRLQAERLWNEYRRDESLVDTDWEKMYSAIVSTPVIGRRTQKRNGIFKIAAAASIVLLLSIGAYLWYGERKMGPETEAPTVAKTNDVKPGQYKAKLTLDDGTIIILDSASDGRLVQREGINVLNKDGKLVYEKSGETNKVLYNTLTTAKGESYATVLSDGTQVWLNSQSSIRYPMAFSGDIRQVEITGEAYFEVAPSVALLANGQKGKRPFIVNAPGIEIEVLGTHFDVNSYADEDAIRTTLLEGKVKVRSVSTNAQIILSPGEQAVAVRQSQALSKAKDVDVDAEVAWRFGMFQFNNADLKTVMRQLERWYDVEVQYSGAVPDREFIGTIPRSLNLSKVLSLLEKQNVHFTLEGKKIIVTP